MSIPGLTDGSMSFKEIGRLRKGAPKESGLRDLDYFRPDFRPDAKDSEQVFLDVYGEAPRAVNIRLPFPEIEKCWDANYEVYNKAGMLGSAGAKGGEALHWLYLRNPKTGERLVHEGQPFTPFNPETPVYSYKNKKGQDVAVFARPVGKLRIVVPELRLLNYMTLVTTSVYDIATISRELAGIAFIAQNVGMSIPLVPLILSRRWDEVSISYNGTKQMKKLSLCHIDVRPDWAAAQFAFLDQLTPGHLPLSLVANIPNDDDFVDGYEDDGGDNGFVNDDEIQFDAADFDPRLNGAPTDPEVDAVETPAMSLELAENEIGSDGKRYGDHTVDELAGKSIGIGKALKKKNLTHERREQLLFKQDAIRVILEHRNPAAPDWTEVGT